MTRQELKEILKDYFNLSNTQCASLIAKLKRENVYNKIIDSTSFLPSESKFRERVYCILNDIYSRVVCVICGEFVNISYSKYCSSKCSNNSNDVIKLKK